MNIYLVEFKIPSSSPRSAVVHAKSMKEAAIKFLETIDEKSTWTISLRIEGIQEIR